MRKSICIVLSLRNGDNEQYRGVNEETLRKDLEASVIQMYIIAIEILLDYYHLQMEVMSI